MRSTTMATTKQQPIHEIRMGAIKATIWENQTTVGRLNPDCIAASPQAVRRFTTALWLLEASPTLLPAATSEVMTREAV
jgi:hypothetical protein